MTPNTTPAPIPSDAPKSWTITDEDIELVLISHGINPTQPAIDNARAALNQPAIIAKLFTFEAFDEQCDSALSDMEDTFMEDGIINPNAAKQFDRPVAAAVAPQA